MTPAYFVAPGGVVEVLGAVCAGAAGAVCAGGAGAVGVGGAVGPGAVLVVMGVIVNPVTLPVTASLAFGPFVPRASRVALRLAAAVAF